MQVFKRENPILAFVFTANESGNNFAELENEVIEAGGSADLVNDGLVRVSVKGRTYDLPIGYVLVLDGGSSRLITREQFEHDYVAADLDGLDIDELFERVGKLEVELGKLVKACGMKEKATKADKAVDTADDGKTAQK